MYVSSVLVVENMIMLVALSGWPRFEVDFHAMDYCVVVVLGLGPITC